MPISPLQALRQRNADKGLPHKITGKQKLAGTVGGAAIAGALIALVATWEGLSNDPYRDLIGKWTVCRGETNVPMRRYTTEECDDMLAGSLDNYATAVLKRNPELRGNQLIAAASLTYNVGIANYRTSTAAKRFSAGDLRGGCNAFMAWNKVRVSPAAVAGYRKRGEKCFKSKNGRWYCSVKGLTNRRAAEYRICMTGL